jgi:hypothetical protein
MISSVVYCVLFVCYCNIFWVVCGLFETCRGISSEVPTSRDSAAQRIGDSLTRVAGPREKTRVPPLRERTWRLNIKMDGVGSG